MLFERRSIIWIWHVNRILASHFMKTLPYDLVFIEWSGRLKLVTQSVLLNTFSIEERLLDSCETTSLSRKMLSRSGTVSLDPLDQVIIPWSRRDPLLHCAPFYSAFTTVHMHSMGRRWDHCYSSNPPDCHFHRHRSRNPMILYVHHGPYWWRQTDQWILPLVHAARHEWKCYDT